MPYADEEFAKRRRKEIYIANREKFIARRKKWDLDHPGKKKEFQEKYINKDREGYLKRQRKNAKARRSRSL